MLSPDDLSLLPNAAVAHMVELEEKLIAEMARRIANDVNVEESIQQLYSMGVNMRDIEREIIKYSDLTAKEVRSTLRKGTEKAMKNDNYLYELAGKDAPGVNHSLMRRFIDQAMKQTDDTFSNLSRTAGFGNSKTFDTVGNFYAKVVDQAIIELNSGFFSHDEVIKHAVDKLAESGLKTVHYDTGRTYSVEAATRMNVLTGMNQITGLISEFNADIMGQDLMEISAHADSRPSHALWQGSVVSRSGQRGYLSPSDIGHGDVDGFQGANCRHSWFPYFEGISNPAASPSEFLEFEYDGKVYDAYEASQKQRSMERQIRMLKRKEIAYKSAGLTKDAENVRMRLRKAQSNYRRFSAAGRLNTKDARLRVALFKEKDTTPKKFSTEKYKNLNSAKMRELGNSLRRSLAGDVSYHLDQYVGSYISYDINDMLRSGEYDRLISEGNFDDDTVRIINSISNLISRNTIDEDAILYRFSERDELDAILKQAGIKNTNLSVEELNEKATGIQYRNKSFVSTSYDRDMNIFDEREVMFEIYTDKGTNAFVTDNHLESEVLLNKNSDFEIMGFLSKNDYLIVQLKKL